MDAQQGFASQGKSYEAAEIDGCICKVEVSSINLWHICQLHNIGYV